MVTMMMILKCIWDEQGIKWCIGLIWLMTR